MNEEKKKRKKIDRKGKDYKPSAYPKTDTSEVKSVLIFETLLDLERVKAHIERRDKVPNTDGYVEIVDGERRPIGSIDVQVKTLRDDQLDRRAFSCDEGFLGFCKKAMRPVILVASNHRNNIALWMHITSQMVKELEVNGSLSVSFPEENTIKHGDVLYIEKWTEIIENHIKKLEFIDDLKVEEEKQKVIQKVLQSVAEGIPVDKSVDVQKVQAFLDEFNDLMNFQFMTAGSFFFPNSRKMGFAYNGFDEKYLGFTIYGIGKQSTDTDIKKLSKEKLDELIYQGLTVRYRSENPILNRPKEFARDIAEEKILKLLDLKGLIFDNEFLAREIIFSVADKMGESLGLEEADSYTLEELHIGLNEFLPRWTIKCLENLREEQLEGVRNVFSARRYIDVGSFNFFFNPVKQKEMKEEVFEEIKQKKPFQIDLPIGCNDQPIRIFADLLEFIQTQNIMKVNRPYPKFDYKRNSGCSWIFNWLSPKDHLEKLKIIYKNFENIYNSIVELNFPNMVNELSIWSEFDKKIIILQAYEKYDNAHCLPKTETLNLMSVDKENIKKEIIVFARENEEAPKVNWSEIEEFLIFRGQSFKIRSMGGSMTDVCFKDTPMLELILSELRERVVEFFKSKKLVNK